MKTVATIRIDTSFPGLADRNLVKMLEDGWVVIEKTVTRDRYIHFVLALENEDFYSEQYCSVCNCFCGCHPCKHTPTKTDEQEHDKYNCEECQEAMRDD